MSGTILPISLQTQINVQNVILFDGICVLCSWGFRWVLKHDHAQRFHFVTAQSETGQAIFKALDLPTDNYETFVVIVDGMVYQKARAGAAVFDTLGGVWKIFAQIKYIPRPLADWVYDRIAKNRYRLFGRKDVCIVPTQELKDRFI